VRVILADDHPDLREEMRRLLGPEFDVLRAVEDGEALLEAAADLRPDAVVTDVRMPRLNGIEAGERVLRRGFSHTVVVLTMYPDANLVKAALAAGIRAFVLKVDAGEELIPAIYAALRGECYLSQGVRGA